MNSTLPVQTTRFKDFSFGLFIGAGSGIIVDVLFPLSFRFLRIYFWDLIYNYNIVNYIFFISTSINLGVLIILLLAVQKKLKNKFVTVGMASGYMITGILLMIVLFQIPVIIK